MPPLPPLPSFLHPLDALPAAINHLLAGEAWARGELAPHAGKTLVVVVSPMTVRMSVSSDSRVERADASAVADTTITVPASALPRFATGGPAAVMRDVRIDGDAEFAQVVSHLLQNLRWDVEEDLSRWIGDVAAHRLMTAARGAQAATRRTGERFTANLTEYLLDEKPQLVRPRAVEVLADGLRELRDTLARLEKRVDRLALKTASSR